MNWKRYHTLLALTVMVASCQVTAEQGHAKSIDLTGSWKGFFSGSDAEGEDSGGMDEYQQRYSVRWTPLITRQIKMHADMAYTDDWIRSLGTREIISPTMRVDVFNDIFAFDLSSYATRNTISYSNDRDSYAWDSDMTSTWQKAWWPTLAVRFGQRWEESDPRTNEQAGLLHPNFVGEDSQYNYGGASVTWEGYKIRLFYDYFRSSTDDTKALTNEDQEQHLGQINFADSYLNNRVNLSLGQTVNQNSLDLQSGSGNPTVKVLLSSAFAGDDLTPSSGRLARNQQLLDNNLDVAAYTIRLQQPANLAIRTDFRTVDQIYVYTTKDSNLLVANTGAVTWDLYTSTDGFSWQRVTQRVTSVYNRDEFRFEVNTGTVRAAYVKLVATGWLPTISINVTELEARSFLTGGQGDYNTTTNEYKTEAYLGIIPLENTHFDYSFTRDETDNTGNRVEETNNEQLMHTARFGWDYSRYFSPSIGFNDVINNYTLAVDTESRSYDLRINSIPIPTVDSSLTLTRSEYLEASDLLFTTDNISLTTLATLYPDLTTELTLGWYLTQRELTEDQSDAYNVRWVLRSRLRRSLTADFTTEYWSSSQDIEIPVDDHLGHGFSILHTSGDSGSNTLNLSWRPSDILSFGATGVSTWGEEGEDGNRESLFLNADYLALRTAKTNVTLSYQFNDTDDDIYNTFSCVWGWDFSRYFTLQTTGLYSLSDLENIWNITTQLTARF